MRSVVQSQEMECFRLFPFGSLLDFLRKMTFVSMLMMSQAERITGEVIFVQ